MKADAGIQERIGHLAAMRPGESGYVCYRSFAATPSYPERNPDAAQRFVNSYGQAQRWVAESVAAAVAECIAGVFPDYPHDVMAESVRRYQAAGVWTAGPQIGRQGYDRTRDALIAGGLAQGYHPCESIVRPPLAERR